MTKISWQQEMLKKLEGEKEFTNWSVEMGRKVKKNISEKLKKEGLIKINP